MPSLSTPRSEFDLDAFLAMPRLADLSLSPDGHRLVTTAAVPGEDGTRFVSSLWEVDPACRAPARRLTWSKKGETAPRFAADGTLLFLSARSEDDEDEEDKLWALPVGGGEARVVAAPPSGVARVAVARTANAIALSAGMHPGASTWEEDEERDKARTDAKVTAQLVDRYPARFWDRWLGPRQPWLWGTTSLESGGVDDLPSWTPLTPDPDHALEEQTFELAPDGRQLVASWRRDEHDPRDTAVDLVLVDIDEDGSARGRRVLMAAERVHHLGPVYSPDGRSVAAVRRPLGSPDAPPDITIVVVDVADGAARELLGDVDLWPDELAWLPDGSGLLFTADCDGRTPVFVVDLASGAVRRLTAEGAFSSVTPSRDGSVVYALQADVGVPHRVVALDPLPFEQEPRVLHAPAGTVTLPTRVERVETSVEDGARVAGWLVLPEEAEAPAPLVLFIHGGPLGSWTGWHWRWNPHVLAAQGYAVLLPDPALSTGYGLDFIRRGWGRWGAEPYTDIMALTDAVARRDDVDADRTAAMGGSFGGYMANWIAGHTERFDAIVTHASIWNLEAFHGTTDVGPYWENEFGDRYTEPERYREWSPHRFVDRITTPMLVIHGERDFRVPVSEGLMLWTDLARHGVEGAYLHFPDENHWILKPQHARVWYGTVLAFLARHVLGADWDRPALL